MHLPGADTYTGLSFGEGLFENGCQSFPQGVSYLQAGRMGKQSHQHGLFIGL